MITFRRLAVTDLPMLHQWLQHPHVAEWWTPTLSLNEVIFEFTPTTRPAHPVQAYIAMLDGRDIGYIQAYIVMGAGDGWWEDERDPGARGIDQFLADERCLGRGIGTSLVRAFVAGLFEDPSVTRVQTDPAPGNARAIRCYEKAGFRRIGEVDTPDGRALLMVCERGASSLLPR